MRRPLLVLFVACSLLALFGVTIVRSETSLKELNQRLENLKSRASEVEQSLESTRNQREEAREKYKEKQRRENNLLELISRYQQLQQESKERLEQLREHEGTARKRLNEIDTRYREVQEDIESREGMLLSRLRSIYQRGQLMQTRMLVNVSDLSELMTNYRYYRRLVRHDRDLIRNYREAKQRLEDLRQERRSVYERRKSIRKDVESTLEQRRDILESRRSFLDSVKEEKNLYRQRLQELEERQQKLKEKVFQFQRERTNTKRKIERVSGQFGEQKGELPWPVESREVLRPYGEWRENGIVHENDGIDIGVESGVKARSVAPGKVVFADNYKGIGEVVIVRHSDSFISLYGSLVEVAVEKGEDVDEGTFVGRAGRTAGMDSPRLYFQIFEGKRTLDPQEWLR